jgi:hypothetical protein
MNTKAIKTPVRKTRGMDNLPSPFKRVLPESLKVGKDKIMLRLDFYSEAIVMQGFEKKGGNFRIVSAHDVANALAGELSFGSGLLPENALWWTNDKSGPMVALWLPPGIRRVALQTEAMGPPERYDVPLPGLIFLCRPGQCRSGISHHGKDERAQIPFMGYRF